MQLDPFIKQPSVTFFDSKTSLILLKPFTEKPDACPSSIFNLQFSRPNEFLVIDYSLPAKFMAGSSMFRSSQPPQTSPPLVMLAAWLRSAGAKPNPVLS